MGAVWFHGARLRRDQWALRAAVPGVGRRPVNQRGSAARSSTDSCDRRFGASLIMRKLCMRQAFRILSPMLLVRCVQSLTEDQSGLGAPIRKRVVRGASGRQNAVCNNRQFRLGPVSQPRSA